MRDTYYPTIVFNKSTNYLDYTAADIPANWAAQAKYLADTLPVLDPSVPLADSKTYNGLQTVKNFVERYDGFVNEQTGNPHIYAQYMSARRDYFPEYPAPRAADAIAKMDAYYALRDLRRTQGKAFRWGALFPQAGVLKPPTVVGPN
jgi:hypothetical protein